ncbi:MAG TPA: GNAT family N-acetyltransferase [Ardenticatenaceae bacterium]|nr:GNAT family N-acetyltransferase [Ardenticatenaceae bacterium]
MTRPRPRRLPFSVRPADLPDLNACLQLDSSYTTETVWQMYLDPGAGPAGASVRFTAVRLPRMMPVPYPRDRDELVGNWQQQEGFLVAVAGDPEAGNERVLGYVDIHLQAWQKAGWVQNFVVDANFRRRGVGTALFEAAVQWGRAERLQRLIFECPTKNGGAIEFFHVRGAQFCGFNDRYYTNHDIALFFDYRL